MEKEAVIEEYDEEDEAERLIEAEEELRDTLLEKDADSDVRVDLSNGLTGYVSRGSVVGGQKVDDEKLVLKVQHEGTTEEYEVEWPDDPTDRNEPLVRICNWSGTSVKRIADLDNVPLLKVNDEWLLVVPPETPTRTAKVTLPGRTTHRVSYISPTSGIRFLAARAFFFLLHTRFIELNDTGPMNDKAAVKAKANTIVPFSMGVGLLAGLTGFLLGTGFLATALTGGLVTIVILFSLYAFSAVAGIGGIAPEENEDEDDDSSRF